MCARERVLCVSQKLFSETTTGWYRSRGILFVTVRCSVLQCVVMCCSVLHWQKMSLVALIVAVCCSVLWCVAACCSVLQCVEVYCSALQPGKEVLSLLSLQ